MRTAHRASHSLHALLQAAMRGARPLTRAPPPPGACAVPRRPPLAGAAGRPLWPRSLMNGGGVGRRAAPPPSAVEAASSAAPSPPTPSASPSALPKVFDPDAEEAAIYASWEASGAFQPRDAAPGETDPPPYFSMAMPPPNVTGRLHMGHAMFVALQDALTRQARMAGRPTLWLPGTDHAGIATQLVVEKQLAAAGESRLALGRAAFEDRVWAWKRDYGGAITRQLRALGASCDWSRERFTLDDGLSAAVREAFVRLADDGLVYRGAYLVNWSPSLRTAVSDLEVEYAEEEGTLYTFKYPLAGAADPTSDGGHLPVATTRPETIPGDAAVAVNPADPRYGHLVGKQAVVPGSGGRTIPIIADDGVDIEFGTGALKITPGHDPADYDIGVKHGLPVINIMDDAGALAGEAAGAYAGLDRFDARAAVWADLGAAGLAISTAPHTSRVPRSQRGGEIVEPLVREQWFVRMGPLAAPALAAVRDGATRVVPPRFAGLYDGWLTNIRDWCVSRQLWWGHRIPVWYVFDDAAAAAASPDGRSPRYVVARDDADAAARAEAAHGPGRVLRQETDVLDTWFSSALWPFSTLGWPADPASAPDLARFYPTSVLETGHDILFFWVARMMMMGIKLTGRPPFHTIYLHGLVRDSAGRKMSKSVGNVVDPVDVIKGSGADALRHTLATGTAAGQDLNLNPEKVAAARNLTNKLWNAGKFVLMSLEAAGEGGDGAPPVRPPPLDTSPAAVAALPLSDRWILAALATTVARVTAAYERHDFGDAGRAAADHFWGDFADWYVESAKPRLYAAGDADPASLARTRAVLLHAYEGALALLHPTMPFVTERLWRALPGAAGRSPDLITAAWPTVEGAGGVDEGALAAHAVLRGVVGAIRNVRAEYGVELGRRVPATIAVADDGLRAALSAELDVIATLAKLDAGATEVVASAPAAGAGRAGAVVSDGVQVSLPLAGLFDVAKELARLAKARDKAAAVADKAAARVGDARFAANAPADVVAKARAEADDAAAKVAALDAKMEEVRRMG